MISYLAISIFAILISVCLASGISFLFFGLKKMTKEQALELIEQYCKILEDLREPDTVLTELVKRWPEDGSEAKAMRWLGFIQGALYAYGYYSLEDVKNHSREKQVKESPENYNYHI